MPRGRGTQSRFETALQSLPADVMLKSENLAGLLDTTLARLTLGAAALLHTHAWSDITSTPTTLAGYGITDAASSSHNHAVDSLSDVSVSGKATGDLLRWNGSNWTNYPDSNFAAAAHSHTFASLTSKPTTLSGYGITDAQPLDSDLTAIAALSTTTFGRSLLTQSDASAAQSTLGLVIGTNVQAYDAELAALAGLTSAADRFPYFTGAGTAALATVTSAARNLLDDTTAGAMATTLGLGAASAVQFGSAVIGDGATGNPRINIDAPAGASSGIAWKVGGVFRWLFYTTNPESGSDAGSDLVFGRAFTDAGVGIDNPITITRASGGMITITRPTSINATATLYGVSIQDANNIALGSTTGTKFGTATTQKLGLWGVTPVTQPAGSGQAAVTLGNTDNEIGGLTISAAYSQAEVQALRDKTEELADDVRNLSTLIHAIRSAGVSIGAWKGAA